MAMIKYILLFIIAIALINLLVFFFVRGVNVSSAAGSFLDTLKERYTFLQDPLVLLTVVSLVGLTVVAAILIRISENT